MGKADNMFKMYVQIGGGAYFCHRCGAKGSWYDFKMNLGGGYDVTDAMGRSTAPPLKMNPKHGYASRNNNHSQNSYSPQQNQGVNSGYGGAQANNQPLPMPSSRLQAAYITNLLDAEKAEESTAFKYLTEKRGLTKQTLRKYGVGLGSYNFRNNDVRHHEKFIKADCITFPWIMRAQDIHEQETLRGCEYNWKESAQAAVKKSDEDGNDASDDALQNEDSSEEANALKLVEQEQGPFVTRRIKARALESKSWQRLDPPGGGWGLFGWHTVPHDATSIVLTEGEYDAMAVHQATGRAAVSLPNGCRSLPVEVLPMLERFEKIYLWMDNDAPGREGAEQFAKKIGVNRCFLVQPSGEAMTAVDPNGGTSHITAPKDANEALLKGVDLEEMIRNADVLPHERILTFSELRSQVLHEMLNPEKYSGVKVPSLPGFTNILKGFRRGEMTVLTGPTGSGKTTFLGQLSLDFAENDVNTMWGSFEIKNTRLMHKLLQQFARGPLPEEPQQKAQALEVLADRFENLPLYFMKFHGGSDIDDVLDAMEYAAYVHDVEHIILDNMQFMITRNSSKYNSSFDKFDIQDIAIEKFRKFATSKNVHVTLVVHPRKEEEGMKLGMSSVYGSAKATQEADNVLILQKDPTNENKKFVEVKKNRYDGTLGICPLHFQFDSKRYSETPDAHSPPPKKAPVKQAAPPGIVPRNAPLKSARSFVSSSSAEPIPPPPSMDRSPPPRSRIRPTASTFTSILDQTEDKKDKK